MTKKELERVHYVIDAEGFDYGFREYSEFADVKDKKFHKLRKAYLEAAKALEDYIEG